jgi:hypothetical protein
MEDHVHSHQRCGRLVLLLVTVAASVVALSPTQSAAAAGAGLAPPAGIVVNASFGDAVVAWNAANGAASYEVLRTTDPVQTPVKLATLSSTSLGYRDKQAGGGAILYYQVVSVAVDGSRAPSAFVKFTAPPSGATGVAMAPATLSGAVQPVGTVTSVALGAATAPTKTAAAATNAPVSTTTVPGKSWLAHADVIYLTENVASRPFPGESSTASGKSELLRFEYDAPEKFGPGGLPLPSAQVYGRSARLTKLVGAATLNRLEAWSVNRTLTTVTVEFATLQSGTPVVLRSYVFGPATVQMVRHFTEQEPSGGIRELEEVSLSFQGMKIYDTQGREVYAVSVN